jgi:DNA-binding beta-propeller fold protein YncE
VTDQRRRRRHHAGRHAIAIKNMANKVAWLDIDGQKVTYDKYDMIVGNLPYNVDISALLRGGNGDKKAFYCHKTGSLAVLKVSGKKVTKIGEVEVGGLPEPAGFSPDGKYLYVGNFIDGDMSIFKVDGTKLTDTGKRMKLDGYPAAMRLSPNSTG